MKVLRAYLEHYFSKDVISGKIALPVGFVLPNSANIKDYVVLINKMNEEDKLRILNKMLLNFKY